MNVQTNLIESDDVTAVEVTVAIPGSAPRRFVGTAKRHPKDEPNPRIGQTLAVARALETAARVLGADADRLVAEANETMFERIRRLYRTGRYDPLVDLWFDVAFLETQPLFFRNAS